MTVRQNIEAGLEASGKSKQEKKDIVERLLEQFHIKELENSYPVRISATEGGTGSYDGSRAKVSVIRRTLFSIRYLFERKIDAGNDDLS